MKHCFGPTQHFTPKLQHAQSYTSFLGSGAKNCERPDLFYQKKNLFITVLEIWLPQSVQLSSTKMFLFFSEVFTPRNYFFAFCR